VAGRQQRPSSSARLDDTMSEKGYLDDKQMAGASAMLNSRDLVWSRLEHEYLMGRSQPVSDLIAWNADATRMPCRQHHEYLHSLYLRNDLAEGRYLVAGKPVVLSDIRDADHVAMLVDHHQPANG
jgi:polyhydroxyalkanoate synthase